MSPWKWWSRRRLAVWDKRLKRRRAIMDSAHAGTPEEFYWETQVTKALAKRVKWRKRAGVRKATGGPVSKGQPFLKGGQGPELFIPYDQGRKLSPPPGKPDPMTNQDDEGNSLGYEPGR